MDSKALAKTALFEHEMLTQISKALQLVLSRKVEGEDLARKLSPVRFISQSLHWHLERLIVLEESDCYRDTIHETHADLPHDARAEALRRRHEEFRAALTRVSPLENLSSQDHATFEVLCGELSCLLHALDEHIGNEQLLLPVVTEASLEDEEVLR